ncbi:hypothetical protein O0L34_g2696 [Tuta absoluta]|nr:hypothetical protein O0L34_g2696 [Tuta absoluta]
MSAKNNNTVIKFTKLPEYDFDSKVQWPRRTTYVLKPHLRRIITLNDEDDLMNTTTRSLKSELASPHKLMSSIHSKRKIVTITEEDDNRSFVSCKKTLSGRSQAPSGSDVKIPTKSTSRNITSRYINKIDTKLSAKNITLSSSKVNNDIKNVRRPRTIPKTREQENNILAQDNNKKSEKEKPHYNKKPYTPKNTPNNVDKNNMQTSLGVRKSDLSPSSRKGKTINLTSSIKESEIIKIRDSKIIRVPIESDEKTVVKRPLRTTPKKRPHATTLDRDIISLDKNVETDQAPVTADVDTETDRVQIEKNSVCVQTVNILKAHFDSLDIPNVTLLKDKDESKEDIVKLCNDLLPDLKVSSLGINPVKEENYEIHADKIEECSQTLPNLNMPDMGITPFNKIINKPQDVTVKQRYANVPDLQMPSLRMTPHKENKHSNKLGMSKSQSYIIGRGTVTYTTKQKIDFHLVSNKQETASSALSSPLAYPLNVVSIFKEEVNKSKDISESVPEDTQQKTNHENSENASHLVNCSYATDCNKLMKPSEIISTIRLNGGLLESDYICEQFQRELNFIDSFFESLQYLENCSLSNKSFTDTSVENWVSRSGFDVNKLGPEYNSLFSTFENGTNIEDTETMASKSLCLLNLLIRDEQRRAKNLLFVLKMREDALKDFAKSQIIWLENRKKHDNIDISTLRKKQRGALLKLQHEYGEMQRMRKALLALSEKRKVALMKTKKNIELKLKNNVSVEQIFLSKKKLKRSSISERATTPLKCFDLSSSGCDESSTSRAKPEAGVGARAVPAADASPREAAVAVMSVDKSIQTGACLLDVNQLDEDAAAEMFVTVDGGYLNILFHHFALPEIFSQGKSYEVNEEAIRSIVQSANSHSAANKSDFIERFINQIKQRDQDVSTTPSTARSLVEEFDHYYKGLTEEDQSFESPERHQTRDFSVGCVVDTVEASTELRLVDTETVTAIAAVTSDLKIPEVSIDENNANTTVNVVSTGSEDNLTSSDKEASDPVATGPLPVPAGAVAAPDAAPGPDVSVFTPVAQTSSIEGSNPSMPVYMDPAVVSSVSPVHNEAEELRRQQLAIEREIKALEQQQCQLLVVREIPDKPPPPYIPPAGAPAPKPAQRFTADDTIEEKVERNLLEPGHCVSEPFDLFVADYCQESAEKHRAQDSDKPWDACNLLPQKPPLSQQDLVHHTARELKEVLTPGTHTAPIASVGTRRSDHIDDILLTEWRGYEPQWTALHAGEATVKNHVFESIFTTIVNNTVEAYKKIIQRDCHVDDNSD